jgi:predicted NBD/HSP70 family sugar kinase
VFCAYLRYLFSIVHFILSPEVVVLGGGVISGKYEVMGEHLERLAREFPFIIKTSQLENKAGMLGAAAYVFEHLHIQFGESS